MIPIDRPQFSKLIMRFILKPRLLKALRFIPEQIDSWQERDFLAVTTKSGLEGVLVIGDVHQSVVTFSLSPLAAASDGSRKPVICDICRTWRRGTEAGRITFLKPDGTNVAFLCCLDLQCSLHVRDKTAASALSRAQLSENLTPEQRVERLRQKLHETVSNFAALPVDQ